MLSLDLRVPRELNGQAIMIIEPWQLSRSVWREKLSNLAHLLSNAWCHQDITVIAAHVPRCWGHNHDPLTMKWRWDRGGYCRWTRAWPILGPSLALNKSLAHTRPKLGANKFRFGLNLMNVELKHRTTNLCGSFNSKNHSMWKMHEIAQTAVKPFSGSHGSIFLPYLAGKLISVHKEFEYKKYKHKLREGKRKQRAGLTTQAKLF